MQIYHTCKPLTPPHTHFLLSGSNFWILDTSLKRRVRPPPPHTHTHCSAQPRPLTTEPDQSVRSQSPPTERSDCPSDRPWLCPREPSLLPVRPPKPPVDVTPAVRLCTLPLGLVWSGPDSPPPHGPCKSGLLVWGFTEPPQ